MSEQPIILNATAYWANLTAPNKLSGKYQIDLGNLSDAAIEKLQSVGVPVKNKPELDSFVTCKSTNEIRYYDKSGENITGVLVGNGSKVKVVCNTYDWTSPTGTKGRSLGLKKLIISELVEYEENGVDSEEYDLDEAL